MTILRPTLYLAGALAALIFIAIVVTDIEQVDISPVAIETIDRSIEKTAAASPGAARPLPDNLPAWEREREDIRRSLDRSLGVSRIYEKSPLNAVVSEKQHLAEGLTVRTLRYDAEPGMTVPALLFEPPGVGPFPAVILFAGHTGKGKSSPEYAPLIAEILRHGVAVLAVDEIGAGERAFTGQHAPELLEYGVTPGGVQIRDGTRAIDLLETIPSIDRNRIGAVGHSGGGFQSFYLAALDERIAAAAAIKYVSSYLGMIRSGLEHTLDNYLLYPLRSFEQRHVLAAIAPRPFLVVSATGDIFPFAETQRTVADAATVYHLFGKKDLPAFAWSKGGHNLSSFDIEKAAAFFARYLGGTSISGDRQKVLRLVKRGMTLKVGIPPTGKKRVEDLVSRLAARSRSPEKASPGVENLSSGENSNDFNLLVLADTHTDDRSARRRIVALGRAGHFTVRGELIAPLSTPPRRALIVPRRDGNGRSLCRAEVSAGNACFLVEPRSGTTANRLFPRFGYAEYRSWGNALLAGRPLALIKSDDLLLARRYLVESLGLTHRDAIVFLGDSGDRGFVSFLAAQRSRSPFGGNPSFFTPSPQPAFGSPEIGSPLRFFPDPVAQN